MLIKSDGFKLSSYNTIQHHIGFVTSRIKKIIISYQEQRYRLCNPVPWIINLVTKSSYIYCRDGLLF